MIHMQIKVQRLNRWKLGFAAATISSAVALGAVRSQPAMALAYNSTGTTFTTSNLSGPFRMAATSGGDVLVTNILSGTVTRYNSSGAFLGNFATGLGSVSGIAINSSNGNVLVGNRSSGTVVQFTSTGTSLGNFATGFSDPHGIAFDSLGNVLIANFQNGDGTNILRYSSTGTALGTFSSTNLDGPSDLEVDGSGNVYVTNFMDGTNGTVRRYNSSGTFLNTFTSGPSTPFQPWNVLIDSSGDILVADRSGGRVLRYNSSGTLLQTLTGLSGPVGLAIGSGNSLLVAEQFNNRIARFDVATPVPFAFCPLWGFLPMGIRRLKKQFSKQPALATK
jgi:streptogramin lyase